MPAEGSALSVFVSLLATCSLLAPPIGAWRRNRQQEVAKQDDDADIDVEETDVKHASVKMPDEEDPSKAVIIDQAEQDRQQEATKMGLELAKAGEHKSALKCFETELAKREQLLGKSDARLFGSHAERSAAEAEAARRLGRRSCPRATLHPKAPNLREAAGACRADCSVTCTVTRSFA